MLYFNVIKPFFCDCLNSVVRAKDGHLKM